MAPLANKEKSLIKTLRLEKSTLCNLIKPVDETGKIDGQKGNFRDNEYLCKLGKEYLNK